MTASRTSGSRSFSTNSGGVVPSGAQRQVLGEPGQRGEVEVEVELVEVALVPPGHGPARRKAEQPGPERVVDGPALRVLVGRGRVAADAELAEHVGLLEPLPLVQAVAAYGLGDVLVVVGVAVRLHNVDVLQLPELLGPGLAPEAGADQVPEGIDRAEVVGHLAVPGELDLVRRVGPALELVAELPAEDVGAVTPSGDGVAEAFLVQRAGRVVGEPVAGRLAGAAVLGIERVALPAPLAEVLVRVHTHHVVEAQLPSDVEHQVDPRGGVLPVPAQLVHPFDAESA